MENIIKEFEKMEMKEEFTSFIKKEKEKLESSNKKYLNTLKVGAIIALGSPMAMLGMEKMGHFSGNALLGLIGLGMAGTFTVGVGMIGSDLKIKKIKDIENQNKVKELFLKNKDKEIQKLGEEEYKAFVEKMKSSDSQLINTLEKVSSKFRKTDIVNEEKIQDSKIRVKNRNKP
tara:strand:- start:6091 stop:6612 length:522 start_codon:yes stop_codon:yes gene_type:complete